MIRLTVPSIDADDLKAVHDVIASGFLVQGPRVAEFEEMIAHHVGTEFAVGVSNCTAALQLALLALNIGRGDRVAVTTYSWPATANVIELCGAQPVFVDIDAQTFNMDPNHLETVLMRSAIGAIVPVHTFGGMADMAAISQLASARGIPVVEDAACALGAELQKKQAGAWGIMGCFSFHPRKAITTGEGGVITTNDSSLVRKLRYLRNHGQDPSTPTPDFIEPGFNMRLTEFQAALGSSQMRKVTRIINARRKAADVYGSLLSGTRIQHPHVSAGSRHVYQSYVVILPPSMSATRADVIAKLRERGIETTVGTYHMPLTTYYRSTYGYSEGDFAITDDVASRALSLPLFEGITEEQQRLVVSELLSFTG